MYKFESTQLSKKNTYRNDDDIIWKAFKLRILQCAKFVDIMRHIYGKVIRTSKLNHIDSTIEYPK